MLSLALAPYLLFGGGTDLALAETIQRLHGSVGAVLVGPSSWPKFEVKEEPPEKEKLPLVVRRFRLDGNVNTGGFSPEAWPANFFFLNRRSHYPAATAKKPGRVTLKDGFVTTVLEAATLSQAVPSNLPERVTWHWFFDSARVAVSAKNAPWKEYVAALADAVGAKRDPKKKTFHLDFDPKAYRKRAVQTLVQLAASDLAGKAEYDFTKLVLQEATDAQLLWLFEEPNRLLEIETKRGSTLHKAAIRRALDLMSEQSPVPRHASTIAAWEKMRDKIEWDEPPVVVVQQTGFCGTRFQGKDGIARQF